MSWQTLESTAGRPAVGGTRSNEIFGSVQADPEIDSEAFLSAAADGGKFPPPASNTPAIILPKTRGVRMQKSLAETILKVITAGEKAGFTLEQMIELLERGLTVESLLRVIEWRLSPPVLSRARRDG